MKNFVGQLTAITNARSIEEVWLLYLERMADYGFDRLLYGYTRFMGQHNFGDLRDAVILTNHEQEYIRLFLDEGFYNHGPMIRWAARHTGACSWGKIERWQSEGSLSEKEIEVVEMNRRMGLHAGYTISFEEGNTRCRAAVGLRARTDLNQEDVELIWAASGDEIVLLSNVAHMRITQLPYSEGRKLTERQREVLQWVADGKTTQDVACLLGLTQATVEKHLRRAREALDAENTAQAILKASVQNQFFTIPG
ncbi:LuxR family transcriptional regulator [Maritimibacter sp. 55A14]|uniref:LuxR family transcriptional regulator n=1 Tax=Maritimibacter sp. 55A14 TaxID=2174844 RepID=UPI000D609679|nr:LuxR family transcriptional regulator [Maritimibacter sp. 55A14]PWE33174.1 LuxR family transcriptional regulator [Maritimibacter sp. 55A14]